MNAALPEVRLIDAVHAARANGATDVHLSSGTAPMMRVDGALRPIGGAVLDAPVTRAMALQLLGAERVARIERGEDISATWAGEGNGSIRVHGYRAAAGITLALRLLSGCVPSLEELRLPAAVAALSRTKRGLILFTGPTGSGKSTSLAAFVERLNATAARSIVTIEDPIEYRHASKSSLIVQREVGADAVSFASALIGALRADPDVIVVGEMRDGATMQAALAAAETGHLVLATLHTGDAAQTVDRIVDAFAEGDRTPVRSQLAQVLAAIVCQHLVLRGDGRGRRLLAEILIANDAVRSIIRDGRTHQLRNVIATSRPLGMQTFEQHARDLLVRGEVDPESLRALGISIDDLPALAAAGRE